jgi:twitching motility protein PilT
MAMDFGNTGSCFLASEALAMNLEKILKVAIRGGASDVLLKTGSRPRFRFNGELVTLSDGEIVTAQIMQEWIDSVLPPHMKKRLASAGDADFGFQSSDGSRFRINLFRQRQTYGMVLRVIRSHIRTVEELQLPPVVAGFSNEKRGLILVTGATGSGKTTTLASIIQKINQERATHIITVEDPIEFNFQDEKSTINQREIGTDTISFSSALRAALRQDPDVILVGELRDQETTQTALMAAETGHLVMSTLHTQDAVESLSRLMGYFEPHQRTAVRQMLAQTLKAVVSQRLVPRADGKGMVAALEVMITNGTIRDVIQNAESFDGLYSILRNAGDTHGMTTFDQSLLNLYETGVITKETALAQATRREDIELLMRGVGA